MSVVALSDDHRESAELRTTTTSREYQSLYLHDDFKTIISRRLFVLLKAQNRQTGEKTNIGVILPMTLTHTSSYQRRAEQPATHTHTHGAT